MKNKTFLCLAFLLLQYAFTKVNAQPGNVQIGAYYFDGWSSAGNNELLTAKLTTAFTQRKPITGWINSKPGYMQSQINEAARAGLSFFSFCWYYRNAQSYNAEPLNKSLRFYLNAGNKSRLKFNLMVANHAGFILGPNEWDNVTGIWISLFKDPQYLKVNGKPLITFFSVPTLVQSFGSVQAVNAAMEKFRSKAVAAGLKGVTIAACVPPNKDMITDAENCGFDVFTGYNYHEIGFKPHPELPDTVSFHQRAIPLSNLIRSDTLAWKRIAQLSSRPYIPVSTLNWDPRPWASNKNDYDKAHYYVGYSPATVYASVHELIDWIKANPNKTTQERIGILYAWNEYGEGAWLTPAKKSNPLAGVRKAILQTK